MRSNTLFLVNLSFLVFLFCAKLIGQNRTLSGQVIYDYRLNLNGIEIPRTATLIFNQDEAVFYHSRGEGFVVIDIYGNIGDHTLTVETTNDNSGRMLVDGYMQDVEGHTFYYDFKKDSLLTREIVIAFPVLYQEKIPEIEWSVYPESKKINGLSCIKAMGSFRGRNYLVWFTPDIPITYGPWKLNGLPGLIVEATDEKGEVAFSIKEIMIPCEEAMLLAITPPQLGEVISFERAKSIWTDIRKKLINQMNSASDRSEVNTLLPTFNLLEKFDEN